MKQDWIDLEGGRRQLDWAMAMGDPAEADYLTEIGRSVARRMISDLEAFFGVGWLHKAVHPGPARRGPTMGPYFAALAGRSGFVEAVGLWARIQLLVTLQAKGIGLLRNNLRRNPVADEFRHHLTLARLANQASHAGARIELEPGKPKGGPGDLLATRGGSSVFVEVKNLSGGRDFLTYDRTTTQATSLLRNLEYRHDVHWNGNIPPTCLVNGSSRSPPPPRWRRKAPRLL